MSMALVTPDDFNGSMADLPGSWLNPTPVTLPATHFQAFTDLASQASIIKRPVSTGWTGLQSRYLPTTPRTGTPHERQLGALPDRMLADIMVNSYRGVSDK